jgi:muramoyltetrapeptide carboxypeptidase
MIPMRLKAGDAIGIVSPSTPVTDELDEQFWDGVDFLESMDLFPVIGEHVRSKTLGYAASPQEKAEDINRMFADEAIKAIICSQGGATANACLPYLDWDAIRANPKVFLGISDITVLLNAIHHKTGLVTFHGDDVVWGFGRQVASYTWQEFVARLMDAHIGAVPPSRERRTVRGGTAEGKLLGGNLLCLLKLAGTPYWPDFTGAILFVEALNITPEGCDYQFRQLEQMGVFDAVRGVIVGYVDGLQKGDRSVLQMEDILLRVAADYDFPILKVNDFGHNCPNTVLPVGGRVKVDADRQTVEILTACVQ